MSAFCFNFLQGLGQAAAEAKMQQEALFLKVDNLLLRYSKTPNDMMSSREQVREVVTMTVTNTHHLSVPQMSQVCNYST